MLTDNSKYMAVIEHLISSGSVVPPGLKNSVCPGNPSVIIQKILDCGIGPEALTTTLSSVFNYPIYDSSKHGEAVRSCEQESWLLADQGDTFFVRNPFNAVMPGQVLEQPLSSNVKTIGILSVVNESDNTVSVDLKVQAKTEKQINAWIAEAIEKSASDIHIIPLHGAAVRVSYRIDGQIQTIEDNHIDVHNENSIYQYISNTLVRMCNIDAGVFTKPVDGKFIYTSNDGRVVEVRLAMRPTVAQGIKTQSFWLRLLSHHHNNTQFLSLQNLGLAEQNYDLLYKLSQSNQNLVLLTGPTGSGKSTTLYSVLQTIQQVDPGKSIQTLEDPIEIHIDGVAQTQISDGMGMGFSDGLRALMRSDVDVILVGEIRDEETAKLAVRAGLTGHLVFATIHCKTSLEAIGRLLDFGVSAQLLATVLGASFAQRLVRRVCPHCSKETSVGKHPSAKHYQSLLDLNTVIRIAGPGCSQCSKWGYKGRVLVSEALPINNKLSQAIIEQNYRLIETTAQTTISLWQHAAKLIIEGQTTLEECEKCLPEYVADLQISSRSLSVVETDHKPQQQIN